jgi:hypothetical protein
MKYEYKKVSDIELSEEELNELGSQGWKLSSHTMFMHGYMKYYYIFVREVLDENMNEILTEDWFLENGFEVEGEHNEDWGPFYYKHNLDCKFLLRYSKFRGDWGFYIEYTDSPFDSDNGKKYPVSFGLKTPEQLGQLWNLITLG